MSDPFDDDPDFDDDNESEFPDDCGMTPSGQCTMAGSEDCDWECPLMSRIIRRQIEAKKKKKAEAQP